jgi:uncharacterized membrane protein
MYNPLEEMYDYERWALNALIVVAFLFVSGVALEEAGVDNPLSEALFEFYLDPISGESSGDSGYNRVNTITYALVLGLFVIAIAAWLRFLSIDPSDSSLLALLPFVTWAAFGEVVEDAEMFGAELAPYFVSPGIHFQAAFWVVLAGAIAYSTDWEKGDDESSKANLESIASVLIIAQFVLYGSSISSSSIVLNDGIGLAPMVVSAAVAIAFTRLSRPSIASFTPIQRMVYLTGFGGSMIFLGALASYAMAHPPEQDRIWPLIAVIGIPALLCYAMYSNGREANEELARHGFVAGILPPGINEEQYNSISSPDKDLIQDLRGRASMAQPLVFLAVAGQVMDGLATWIGIDGFPGLSEKHIVSQGVIDWGLWLNEKLGITHGMLDEGVWLFTLVKFALAALIYYFFSILNFEHRERHLRLLVGLAMLVVGMAPGLRDVGRLTLGV